MTGWKRIWRMPVKNKSMRLNSANSKKNNDFVNMWFVKNYQTFYEIKKVYFLYTSNVFNISSRI